MGSGVERRLMSFRSSLLAVYIRIATFGKARLRPCFFKARLSEQGRIIKSIAQSAPFFGKYATIIDR